MALLEYDILKKRWVNKITTQLKFEVKNNNTKYKFKEICNSAVYTKKLEDYLSNLYFIVLYKSYPKKKNI